MSFAHGRLHEQSLDGRRGNARNVPVRFDSLKEVVWPHYETEFSVSVRLIADPVNGACNAARLLFRQIADHGSDEAMSSGTDADLDAERPDCPRCNGTMTLARIEPYPMHDPTHDPRTFDCARCGGSESYIIERGTKRPPSLWPP